MDGFELCSSQKAWPVLLLHNGSTLTSTSTQVQPERLQNIGLFLGSKPT